MKRIVIFALGLLGSVGAFASNFRAADQVYVPAVGRVSNFKQDVVIRNVSDATVKVEFALSQGAGGTPNATAPANLKTIATLAPGEVREFLDFVKNTLGLDSALGMGVFFACRDGGNCSDCNANSTDCKNIVVESRFYSEPTAGCAAGKNNCTTGQLFSGIPFYNYVSADAASRNLDKVTIVGVRATGVSGDNGYRSNIGVASATNTGTMVVTLKAYKNETPNTVFGNPVDITLGPLGQTQASVTNLFPGFSGAGFVTVEQKSFTPTPGETDPVAGFLAYGSLLDNVTNDAITLESFYSPALDFACVYGAGKPTKRLVKKQ